MAEMLSISLNFNEMKVSILAKKPTKYFSDLYRKHAQMFEMTISDSEQVVDSVIQAIMEVMSTTEVLNLTGFGKFETKYRAPYTMVDNFPKTSKKSGQGVKKNVPGRFKVKFTAYPALNEAATKYFGTNDSSEIE